MEPISITIANELSSVSVAQAAVIAYCRSGGVDESTIAQTELVIEEIISAIIKHEYLPGQKAQISMDIVLDDRALALRIRFQGVPLDVEKLLRWEKTTPLDILAAESDGMNLGFINWFGDEITYANRGWQGQEIVIRRQLPGTVAHTEIQAVETPASALKPQTVIRRMHPGEAAAVSRVAYCSYGYTYFKEYFYEPEEVRKRNEDGRLISYVAVDDKDGTVMGHVAAIPGDLSGFTELGAGFVNPHYRQSGVFQVLLDMVSDDLRNQGHRGIFGTAVTSHPYSQHTVISRGWKETALFVSRMRAMSFQAITERETTRESMMHVVRFFDCPPRLPYYAPERHRDVIAAIAGNSDMEFCFSTEPSISCLPKTGEWEESTDANQTAHFVLRRWGSDSVTALRTLMRPYSLNRLETFYIYLPLFDPATALFCPDCEDMGFFFSGLKPGRDGADWLILQYLNNQRYDYEQIRAATPFGQGLIEYVRDCDPDAPGRQ